MCYLGHVSVRTPLLIANASDKQTRPGLKALELVKESFSSGTVRGRQTSAWPPLCDSSLEELPTLDMLASDEGHSSVPQVMPSLYQHGLTVYARQELSGEPAEALRATFLSSLLSVPLTTGFPTFRAQGVRLAFCRFSSPSFSLSMNPQGNARSPQNLYQSFTISGPCCHLLFCFCGLALIGSVCSCASHTTAFLLPTHFARTREGLQHSRTWGC